MEFKLWPKGTANTLKSASIFMTCGSNIVLGLTGKMALDSTLAFSVPYYSGNFFEPTNVAAANTLFYNTALTFYESKRAGDDFSYHWLCAPPAGASSVITNANSRQYALQTYLAS